MSATKLERDVKKRYLDIDNVFYYIANFTFIACADLGNLNIC
jgi:hypothetical protein